MSGTQSANLGILQVDGLPYVLAIIMLAVGVILLLMIHD